MSEIDINIVSCIPAGANVTYKGKVEHQRNSEKDPTFTDVINREGLKLRQSEGASSEPGTSEKLKGFSELHLSFTQANGRERLTIVDLVEGNEGCAIAASQKMDVEYGKDVRVRQINYELAELKPIASNKGLWKGTGIIFAILSTIPITASVLKLTGAGLSKPSDSPAKRYGTGASIGAVGLAFLAPLGISLLNGSWEGNESDRIDALRKELNQYDQNSIAPTSISVAPTRGGVQAAATWRF